MKRENGKLNFSPSDLTRFIESEFITWMDRYDLEHPFEVERDEDDETAKLLQRRGIQHEKDFLTGLEKEGRDIIDIASFPRESQYEETQRAMKDGREVIFQASLKDSRFFGFSDFLFKVEGESGLGDYHYEPWDTKLALKAKPYFLVQLACYADMLQVLQGILPRQLYVVLGSGEVKPFRTQDYFYYYRQIKESLIRQQDTWSKDNPPDFNGMENFGRWQSHAEKLIEKDDHLCQVANIRRSQIKKLYDIGINTMAELAECEIVEVPKLGKEIFCDLKQQARLQIDSKKADKPLFEMIKNIEPGKGLSALPPASSYDVYFDIEGFPFADHGLEYLLGVTFIEDDKPVFKDWWAHDEVEEKASFESFIDWVYDRFKKDPRMHIYHYASYEKTALKRLMGKYGVKEKEIDDLLRNEVLVDLYRVVRQSIKVGEPNYSLKSIEHLYMDKRKADVSTAIDSVVQYQRWLDNKDGDDYQCSKILKAIRDYNIEDCDSTWMLAAWLRKLKEESGIKWSLPEVEERQESDSAKFRKTVADFAQGVLKDVQKDHPNLDDQAKMKELLAYLTEFHWREAKPVFWAQYERAEMTEAELFEDSGCLAGLTRTAKPEETRAKSFIYEYDFDPSQDTKIDAGDNCMFAHDTTVRISVDKIEADEGKIYLKRGKAQEKPPTSLSLIKSEYVDAQEIAESIYRTAKAFMEGKPLPAALEDFLLRRAPDIRDFAAGDLIDASKDLTGQVVDLVSRLDESVLCIQGPPGSGKTYTAAKAILELMRQGKTVGVTSNSHKAIANLIDKVAELAKEERFEFKGAKIQSNAEDFHVRSSSIEKLTTRKFFDSDKEHFSIVGGTAWLFSKPAAVNLVDYLFIDESGQVSVANLVGMAPCTTNLVLVGDQMQLSQPIKGVHPGESGLSILEYLLQGKQVIPPDFGIFLSKSWRMHPDVCSFISGAVYEGRLFSESHTVDRVLNLTGSLNRLQSASKASLNPNSSHNGFSTDIHLKESGLVYIPVEHEGNAQDSEEEALIIKQIIERLKNCTLNDNGTSRAVSLDDILIVAPYNMQVRRLRALIPDAKVGSVDKFQGQEAPIVIVSMSSSTGDASPRGLEFIFSKNRLNVAISRAQTLAIVVGSPSLAHTQCKQVDEMELVNLFCRIVRDGSVNN